MNEVEQPKRHLKVQPKYFKRARKQVVFPEIRLCGKWLEESGFACGQEVVVEQGRERIVIRVITLPE